jgi:hypothetical protein
MPCVADFRYGVSIDPRLFDELFNDESSCSRQDLGDETLRSISEKFGLDIFIPPGVNRQRLVSLASSTYHHAIDETMNFTIDKRDKEDEDEFNNVITKFMDELAAIYKKNVPAIKNPVGHVGSYVSYPSWMLTSYVE